MSEYAHPEVLVSTQWAADHLNDPKVRLIEVDVDTTAYDQGHIPGAVGWNWQTQLQDNVRRDLIDKAALEKLLGQSGISERHDHHSLRRQQQLVRGLWPLAAEVLRPQGCPLDQRRPQEMGGRKASAHDRRRQGRVRHLPCGRPGRDVSAPARNRSSRSSKRKAAASSWTCVRSMNSPARSSHRRA